MDGQINYIIKLFHKEKPIQYVLKEIRSEDHDSRWVVFVDFPKEKFVIKIAANDFTTKERVTGWVKIIDAYRDLGYYSPAILKSTKDNYAENVTFNSKSCVVWEEEYAKYHLRSTLDPNVYTTTNGGCVYHDDILKFVGKVAQKHYDIFPYKSGWVRFEPFGSNDTTDEIAECVNTFDILVKKNTPHYISRWEKILNLFEENKKQLVEIYNDLPTSVFQSDHFGDNLLLDDDGHFKGVIDYNLSGQDTVINVFLYTMLFDGRFKHSQTDNPNMLPEYNPRTQDYFIEYMLDTLKFLRKFYTFNEKEAQAFLPLYKYISCIEYKQIGIFKKYKDDDDKLNLLFNTMEYELMRKETRFFDAMLKNQKS